MQHDKQLKLLEVVMGGGSVSNMLTDNTLKQSEKTELTLLETINAPYINTYMLISSTAQPDRPDAYLLKLINITTSEILKIDSCHINKNSIIPEQYGISIANPNQADHVNQPTRISILNLNFKTNGDKISLVYPDNAPSDKNQIIVLEQYSRYSPETFYKIYTHLLNNSEYCEIISHSALSLRVKHSTNYIDTMIKGKRDALGLGDAKISDLGDIDFGEINLGETLDIQSQEYHPAAYVPNLDTTPIMGYIANKHYADGKPNLMTDIHPDNTDETQANTIIKRKQLSQALAFIRETGVLSTKEYRGLDMDDYNTLLTTEAELRIRTDYPERVEVGIYDLLPLLETLSTITLFQAASVKQHGNTTHIKYNELIKMIGQDNITAWFDVSSHSSLDLIPLLTNDQRYTLNICGEMHKLSLLGHYLLISVKYTVKDFALGNVYNPDPEKRIVRTYKLVPAGTAAADAALEETNASRRVPKGTAPKN